MAAHCCGRGRASPPPQSASAPARREPGASRRRGSTPVRKASLRVEREHRGRSGLPKLTNAPNKSAGGRNSYCSAASWSRIDGAGNRKTRATGAPASFGKPPRSGAADAVAEIISSKHRSWNFPIRLSHCARSTDTHRGALARAPAKSERVREREARRGEHAFSPGL